MARPVSAVSKLSSMYRRILADKGTTLPQTLYQFALEWAIVVVNNGQTPDEKQANRTLYTNGKGWRACHATHTDKYGRIKDGKGVYLAKYIENGIRAYGNRLGGCLSGTWIETANKTVACYWRQFGPTLTLMLSRYQETYGNVANVVNEAELLSLPCPDDDNDDVIEAETPVVTAEVFQLPPSSREVTCKNCGCVAVVKFVERCNECGILYASLHLR